MASDIAFEQIQDNYWYGAFDEFRVVMMKDNGFINVTKMCSSGGRDFKDWNRLKGSAQLIAAFEKQWAVENTMPESADSELTLRDRNVQIPTLRSPPCIIIKNFNITPTEQLISGTYIHPDLVPSVVRWISPFKFANCYY